MLRRHLPNALALLAVTLLFAVAENTFAQQRQTVSGEILDTGNKGIGGVTVNVERGGKYVGRTTSGPDGSYTVSFDSGGIVTIKYEPFGKSVQPLDVQAVAGNRDQRISIVLSRSLAGLSVREATDVIRELNDSFLLALQNGITLQEAQKNYSSLLKVITINQALEGSPSDLQLLEREHTVAARLNGLKEITLPAVNSAPLKTWSVYGSYSNASNAVLFPQDFTSPLSPILPPAPTPQVPPKNERKQ